MYNKETMEPLPIFKYQSIVTYCKIVMHLTKNMKFHVKQLNKFHIKYRSKGDRFFYVASKSLAHSAVRGINRQQNDIRSVFVCMCFPCKA